MDCSQEAFGKFGQMQVIWASTKNFMQRLLTVLIFLATTWPAFAQKIEKVISEKYVTRVISELASDEMRGRSASRPEDINKAAALIETEFKKAKLGYFGGLTTYRQEFEKDRLTVTSLTVVADGLPVEPGNVFTVSDKEKVSLNQSAARQLKDGENLFQVYQARRRETTDQIILVPASQQQNFERLHGYLTRPRIVDAGGTPSGSTIYVLLDSAQAVTAEATIQRETITMANVVGVLEGKSKKDEIVVFSGHYDHIGIQAPVNGDSIANGADDDASGTTAVIALAKYFTKAKMNERTLMFVAFTAEEIGGFGSRYFSEQLNPDKVMAMFNIEMIGKPSKWGTNSAFITGFERSSFGEILQKNLEGTPFSFYPDPYPEQNLFYRSDNATLARLGVPAHSISTDQIPTDQFYHTVDDEVETLDMNNLTVTIRSIAASATSLVKGTDTPTRVDKAAVRQ